MLLGTAVDCRSWLEGVEDTTMAIDSRTPFSWSIALSAGIRANGCAILWTGAEKTSCRCRTAAEGESCRCETDRLEKDSNDRTEECSWVDAFLVRVTFVEQKTSGVCEAVKSFTSRLSARGKPHMFTDVPIRTVDWVSGPVSTSSSREMVRLPEGNHAENHAHEDSDNGNGDFWLHLGKRPL